MEKFRSLEFLLGIGLSFRDKAMKTDALPFPSFLDLPHSTPTCRQSLAPTAQRIEEEESKVLREIRKKEKEGKVAGCCLEERDKKERPR